MYLIVVVVPKDSYCLTLHEMLGSGQGWIEKVSKYPWFRLMHTKKK